MLAGFLPMQLSSFQFFDGLIGRGANPLPQFGQTLSRTVSTQVAQNVHSKLQMRASSDSGGNGLLQCSQVGLSSSMMTPSRGGQRPGSAARAGGRSPPERVGCIRWLGVCASLTLNSRSLSTLYGYKMVSGRRLPQGEQGRVLR